MRASAVILVTLLAFAYADGRTKIRTQKRYDQGAFGRISSEYHQGGDREGYSAGSGLRSIAQGSAHRAHSAVANQKVAAQQASYIAQTTFAQEAIQAAATARAALAGKEVVYNGLERQVADAQNVLEGELKHLQLAERTALAAKEAADSSVDHVSILGSALNNANAAAEHAKVAADEAAAEVAAQTSMVGRAQERLSAISAKFQAAEADYEATRQAAEKASAAAQVAQDNASNAGSYASQKLQESAWNTKAEAGSWSDASSSRFLHHQF